MRERAPDGRAEEDAVEALTDEMTAERRRADAVGEDTDRGADATAGGEERASSLRPRLDGIVESLLFAAGAPPAPRRPVHRLAGPPGQDGKAPPQRLVAEDN